MAIMTYLNFKEAVLIVLLHCLVQLCEAGEYCRYSGNYCSSGCCDDYDGTCCSDYNSSVALIVGLCIGGGVLAITAIVIIIICRRRRSQGMVYRQGPLIVPQTTVVTQGGVVSTAGVQPGYMAPPYNQPYAAAPYGQQPTALPYGQQPTALPYGQQPTAVPNGQAAYPYNAYAAALPAYNDAMSTPGQAPTAGGLDNPAFNGKN